MSKVAVVTRTKNRKVLLRRALESVLGQTFRDWTMVIVNDGGAPGDVEELVSRHRDRFAGRVQIVHHEKSLGMEAASNAGIRATQSDYLVIHDDDDSWHPDFLAECVAFLEKNAALPHLAGVVAHSLRIAERIDGDRIIEVAREPFNTWVKAITLYRMAACNMFPPISFVFRRSVIDEIGAYREDLPVLGDWEFNLRFVSKWEIGVIQRPLAYYHHRLSLKTGDYGNTVIAGDHLHKFYDAFLRNDLLRRDLQNNTLGLGLLVNVARSFEDILGQMGRASFFLYMKDKVYNFAQRARLFRS